MATECKLAASTKQCRGISTDILRDFLAFFKINSCYPSRWVPQNMFWEKLSSTSYANFEQVTSSIW